MATGEAHIEAFIALGRADDEVGAAAMLGRVCAGLFGDAPGRVELGRYEVIDHLGSGGMGTVYRARDPRLDREVALKIVRPRAGASEEVDGRLAAEARTLARLAHPNVVTVYEVQRHDGRLFIAMELVDGADARVWAERVQPDWRAVVEVYIQAGRGLAAAHAVGIVHRDVKPANIVVGAAGRVKVVDFGVASVQRAATRAFIESKRSPGSGASPRRSTRRSARGTAGGGTGDPARLAASKVRGSEPSCGGRPSSVDHSAAHSPY